MSKVTSKKPKSTKPENDLSSLATSYSKYPAKKHKRVKVGKQLISLMSPQQLLMLLPSIFQRIFNDVKIDNSKIMENYIQRILNKIDETSFVETTNQSNSQSQAKSNLTETVVEGDDSEMIQSLIYTSSLSFESLFSNISQTNDQIVNNIYKYANKMSKKIKSKSQTQSNKNQAKQPTNKYKNETENNDEENEEDENDCYHINDKETNINCVGVVDSNATINYHDSTMIDTTEYGKVSKHQADTDSVILDISYINKMKKEYSSSLKTKHPSSLLKSSSYIKFNNLEENFEVETSVAEPISDVSIIHVQSNKVPVDTEVIYNNEIAFKPESFDTGHYNACSNCSQLIVDVDNADEDLQQQTESKQETSKQISKEYSTFQEIQIDKFDRLLGINANYLTKFENLEDFDEIINNFDKLLNFSDEEKPVADCNDSEQWTSQVNKSPELKDHSNVQLNEETDCYEKGDHKIHLRQYSINPSILQKVENYNKTNVDQPKQILMNDTCGLLFSSRNSLKENESEALIPLEKQEQEKHETELQPLENQSTKIKKKKICFVNHDDNCKLSTSRKSFQSNKGFQSNELALTAKVISSCVALAHKPRKWRSTTAAATSTTRLQQFHQQQHQNGLLGVSNEITKQLTSISSRIFNGQFKRGWICSYKFCQSFNSYLLPVCKQCCNPRYKNDQLTKRDILCNNCGYVNYRSRLYCKKCKYLFFKPNF